MQFIASEQRVKAYWRSCSLWALLIYNSSERKRERNKSNHRTQLKSVFLHFFWEKNNRVEKNLTQDRKIWWIYLNIIIIIIFYKNFLPIFSAILKVFFCQKIFMAFIKIQILWFQNYVLTYIAELFIKLFFECLFEKYNNK